MNRLLRVVFVLVCSLGLAFSAWAQTTTITASHERIMGYDIPLGTVYAVAVDLNGLPITFADATGAQNGGQGALNAVNPVGFGCHITTGAIDGAIQNDGTTSGTCSLPDSALTTPANIRYAFLVCDTSAGNRTSGKCFMLQSVAGVTGTTWPLDHYGPPATTTNIATLQMVQGSITPTSCTSPSLFTNTFTHSVYTCVDGMPVQVGAVVRPQPSMFASVLTQGDSITAGTGASVYTNDYASQLAAHLNAHLDDPAIGGSLAADVTFQQTFQQPCQPAWGNGLNTLLIGTNAANTKGVGAYEQVEAAARQAIIAWMTVPCSSWVLPGSSNVVTFGTYTINSYFANFPLVETITQGSGTTWTVTTTGGPIFILYQQSDSDNGTESVTIDGIAAAGLTTAAGVPIATQNGGTGLIALARYSVAAGTHTITLTQTSSTVSSYLTGGFRVGAVGTTPQVVGHLPPALYVGGVPRQENDAKSAITAQYDADVRADVASFAALGLKVFYVPVRLFFHSTPAEMFDLVHPDDLGHSEIDAAFESVIPWIPNNPPCTTPAGTFTTYTNVRSDCAIAMQGGTLTLSTFIGGTPSLHIANYAVSGGASLTVVPPVIGTAGMTGNVTLAPGESMTVFSFGGGVWFVAP